MSTPLMPRQSPSKALALLCRWSVVVLMLAVVMYLGSDVKLSPEEITKAKDPYLGEYYISANAIHTSHDISSGKLMISIIVSPKIGGEEKRINILYDRTRKTMDLVNIEPVPVGWKGPAVKGLIMLAICVFWLKYLDPLLAGRICRRCRLFGFLPRPLNNEQDRTIHPEARDVEGGWWPEIIETDRYCSHCNYHEYSVRERSTTSRSILGPSSLKSGYVSDDLLNKAITIGFEKGEGISREEYEARLAEAQQSAEIRNDLQ